MPATVVESLEFPSDTLPGVWISLSVVEHEAHFEILEDGQSIATIRTDDIFAGDPKQNAIAFARMLIGEDDNFPPDITPLPWRVGQDNEGNPELLATDPHGEGTLTIAMVESGFVAQAVANMSVEFHNRGLGAGLASPTPAA